MKGLSRLIWNTIIFSVLVLLYLGVISSLMQGRAEIYVLVPLAVFYTLLYPLIKA